MAGDQWLKLDVFFLGRPFPVKIAERYGAAGVLTWIAFLAACKRNCGQGHITFGSEPEAYRNLFLGLDVALMDSDGKPWTLEEFFAFTRRHHQTRRTTRGRVKTERATDWERWQNEQKTSENRVDNAERQRRSRAKKARDARVTENEREKEKEIESDAVTSASSQGADATAGESTPASSVNGFTDQSAALATVKASLQARGGT